ncbi:MAG TPA: hypothetical protein VF718_06455 [Allosphingosinicella sp.]|jgi:hypothetical protein
MRRWLIALSLAVIALPGPAAAKPAPAASAVDIRTLHLFAACMADRYRPGLRKLLALDYRSRGYDHLLRTLTDEGARCLPFAFGKLGSADVLLAGAFAEQLLPSALDGSPLAKRVAYNPSRPPVAARDEGEYLALCAVRTMPDDVAALLATKPASEAERLAIAALSSRLGPCLRAGAAARVNAAGLRAILALAAYRLTSSPEPAARPSGGGDRS